MALGTKEDGHFAWEVGKEEELIIFKGLYSPNFFLQKVLKFGQLASTQVENMEKTQE